MRSLNECTGDEGLLLCDLELALSTPESSSGETSCESFDEVRDRACECEARDGGGGVDDDGESVGERIGAGRLLVDEVVEVRAMGDEFARPDERGETGVGAKIGGGIDKGAGVGIDDLVGVDGVVGADEAPGLPVMVSCDETSSSETQGDSCTCGAKAGK